jgi:hypothetical protein
MTRNRRGGIKIVMAVLSLAAAAISGWRAAAGSSCTRTIQDRLGGVCGEADVLVKQLDAPTLADREEAERKLLELGSAVLEFLPGDEGVSSPEARFRLRRVREKLLLQLGKRMLEPSLVTVAEGVSISEALQQISLQSRNPVRFVFADEGTQLRAAEVRLPHSIDGEPFWKCLDKLLAAGGFSASFFAGESTIEIREGLGGWTPSWKSVCYVGPFRLEIVRVLLADAEPSVKVRELTLWAQVAWEPRLRPIVLYWLGEKFDAETTTGRRVRAAPGERTREIQPIGQGFFVEVPIRLVAEEGVGDTLRIVRGVLAGVFPGPKVTFSFRLQDRMPQAYRQGDATAILEAITPLADRIVARLRAAYGQAFTAFESHRGWFYENRPVISLPQQGEVAPGNIEPVLQMPNQVALQVEFPDLAEVGEAKLLWDIPAAILREEFVIQFQGVSFRLQLNGLEN